MNAKAQADKLYHDIMEYISDAREISARGEYIELHKLDGRVEQLCEAVQNLTVEDSVRFHDDLQMMMKELNDLQTMFAEKRDGLAQDITGVGKHKQAAMAYKQQEVTSARSADAKLRAQTDEE